MKSWGPVFFLLGFCLSPLGAKTKLLVEDPNNVVVGRYGLTKEQKAQAIQNFESILAQAKEKDRQRAYAVRYVAIDAGPLTGSQVSKEPDSLRKAQKRFARYGVFLADDAILRPVAIYDTERERIIHGRLYTITELPAVYRYGRMDDYVVFYMGGPEAGKGFAK
jgi:hypothetical protein